MAIKLPTPIEIYFASGNATDAAAFEQCFAPDAVVRDEAKTITGLVAIKAWRSETKKKYRFTAEPVAIADRDGKVVVTAKVSDQPRPHLRGSRRQDRFAQDRLTRRRLELSRSLRASTQPHAMAFSPQYAGTWTT
jgi:hypothetical protein